jgi:hypothetical protein
MLNPKRQLLAQRRQGRKEIRILLKSGEGPSSGNPMISLCVLCGFARDRFFWFIQTVLWAAL